MNNYMKFIGQFNKYTQWHLYKQNGKVNHQFNAYLGFAY